MFFETFFWAQTLVALFINFKTAGSIEGLSNYKKFKLDAIIGHPRNFVPITIAIENFVVDTILDEMLCS